MATYRVVCVDTEHPHRHITHAFTGPAADSANKCWTVAEVRTAIVNGDTFYTVSTSTGKRAGVRLDDCRSLGRAARARQGVKRICGSRFCDAPVLGLLDQAATSRSAYLLMVRSVADRAFLRRRISFRRSGT
jgi:hypothetical protein